MSYEDYRAGYIAGYTIGYGDGVRRMEPDDRPLAIRLGPQAVRLETEEDGQPAFDFGEGAED